MSVVPHASELRLRDAGQGTQPRTGPAAPSDAERNFWRRAVAIERSRHDRARPAPFPFQDN